MARNPGYRNPGQGGLWLLRRELTAMGRPEGQTWYVDKNADNASDSNSGKSWDEPLETIGAARTLHNATISWADDAYSINTIYVAPGVYAETLGGLYYLRLIGTGVRGTDGMVEVSLTGYSALAGTLLDCYVENIYFGTDTQDTPVLDVGIGNSAWFQDCMFALDGNVSGVAGIDTDNSTHLTVRGCSFESGQAQNLGYGIYARGGANVYLHQARIVGNNICAATAGIWIQDTCTASGAVIADNWIYRPTKGIDDNSGTSYCINNFISASSDAIEHANSSTQCIGNHVINNATGAKEASGT